MTVLMPRSCEACRFWTGDKTAGGLKRCEVLSLPEDYPAARGLRADALFSAGDDCTEVRTGPTWECGFFRPRPEPKPR